MVGVREPSGREAGVGRAGFGESSLLWCLVWLKVSLTRTSEKMACPSGRPTGACQVSALGPWGQQQGQPPCLGWGGALRLREGVWSRLPTCLRSRLRPCFVSQDTEAGALGLAEVHWGAELGTCHAARAPAEMEKWGVWVR